MIRRYIFLIAGMAAAVAVYVGSTRSPLQASRTAGDDELRSRSINFSHQLHIVGAGIDDCTMCHNTATTSKFSSDQLSAGHDACMSCHEEKIADEASCGFCHNSTIDIQAIPAAKRDFKFSHELHAGMEGVTCATCHQGLDQTDKAGPANLPSMATCNTCHDDRKATNTCESCHNEFVTLMPIDHQRSDFARNHSDMTRIGALNTDCQTCHTERFCQQCHFSPDLKRFGGTKDLSTEPAHKTSTKDSPKKMLLQNVHELNYRFTHGIDARSKQSDCQSCHSVQTFCAECHDAGGNITQLRFKPASHGAPGFTTLGRGSGGGLHAEEARRDMESCMSCHDVEGKDPTCMTCHLSTGRVR